LDDGSGSVVLLEVARVLDAALVERRWTST